jgi:hypothetical protein
MMGGMQQQPMMGEMQQQPIAPERLQAIGCPAKTLLPQTETSVEFLIQKVAMAMAKRTPSQGKNGLRDAEVIFAAGYCS